ncbi:MAG TPA: 4-(cytidine 5'-diphospho)-2-C-methyl-D-erythritol kinase [Gemmatimonadales bacterium]|jgi:4-diphosphocytidyl-2-C-methyl-D-erythritol kinase|nr:4-(cytidine 5'-diphospho)-2-C-methyl-D-erythritol kinase [Gemmatimonadales bacterium]
MTTHEVTLPAHAKLNLLLRVLARESDGFHGLETLFCLVSLADSLRAERREGKGVTVDVAGADVGPPEQNLAVRAAGMVLDATGHRFAVHLSLEKRIPLRAGLGGGSSDGAAALVAVNQLAGNAVPRHELLQFAARLGSDVPFFLSGAPLALGWGRGERLLALPPLPAAPVLLVTPPVGVGTPEAYRWLDAARQSAGRRGAVALDLDALSRWGDIGRLAGNDFESVVFARVPAIRAAFEALVRTRPVVCRMSGSGSTLFAVYRSARDRDDARSILGRKHGRVDAAETLIANPAN